MHQKPKIHTVIIITILFISFSFKSNNPKNYFDTQYTDAINYCKENKHLINNRLSECCLPSAMALSVAFPEMLRYTLWRDLFETKALEHLYIKRGKKAADFSIGWLQMKPSFAETVEYKIQNDTTLSNKYKKLYQYTNLLSNTVDIRSIRVIRLKQFEWQLEYLSAFIDLNCNQFRAENVQYKDFLKYLAAAYNRGMCSDINELADFASTKTFPYGPGRKNPFGFVEVAEYFYMSDARQIFN